MSSRVYLICSLFFVAGAVLAFKSAQTPVNWMNLIGSVLFFVAAGLGVVERNKNRG